MTTEKGYEYSGAHRTLEILGISIGFFRRTEAVLRWVFRNPKTPTSQSEASGS